MSSHEGRGPDGANLLGFLSALGAFLSLTRALSAASVRMAWVRRTAWRPVWTLAGETTEDTLIASVEAGLRGRDAATQELTLGEDLTITSEAFRGHALNAQKRAHEGHREYADHLQAMGCELPDDKGSMRPTVFETMSGAGHQHFLGFMAALRTRVTSSHLRAALLHPWRYEDLKLSLRWDPADDRRYAHRASDPASDAIRSVWGANLLAAEALALCPTAPQGDSVATVATARERSEDDRRELFMRWPMWTRPLSLGVLRSLLTHPSVYAVSAAGDANDGHRRVLSAMGVAEVFRAKRLLVGRYKNIAPSESCFLGGAALR